MRFLFLLILLSACTNPKSKNTLRISFNTDPNTIDPQKAGDFISSTLVCMIYEGLTRCEGEGKVKAALAESYEVSEDQTTYIFHLRDAYWSDGSPITAYDFERSWKRALVLPSLSLHLFYPIKNVEKLLKNEASIDQVGIYAQDAKTFIVKLEREAPHFYELTAFPSFLVSKEEKVFSGPFQMVAKKIHGSILLKKNPFYWNQKSTHLDAIHIAIIPDETTAIHLFQEGMLDFLGGPISPLPIDSLEKFKSQIIHIPSAGSTLLTFNTQNEPFSNKDLRKAFSYAIDRQMIVDEITCKTQIAATTTLPPVFSTQVESFYDPIKARYHFQKALETIESLPPLILYYRPSQMEKRLAQILQVQWREKLGVEIMLVQLDFKSHTHKLHTKNYQISTASWIAQYNDPMSILDRYLDKDGAKNYPGWESKPFIEMVQNQNYLDAEKVLFEEMPLTPIYHWSSPSLKGERIEKMATSICGGILFEQFKLNEP